VALDKGAISSDVLPVSARESGQEDGSAWALEDGRAETIGREHYPPADSRCDPDGSSDRPGVRFPPRSC